MGSFCFLLPGSQNGNITNNKTQAPPQRVWPLLVSDFHLEELLEFTPLHLMPRDKMIETQAVLVSSVQEARRTRKLKACCILGLSGHGQHPDKNCLAMHTSCPLFKPKPHVRTPKIDLRVTGPHCSSSLHGHTE